MPPKKDTAAAASTYTSELCATCVEAYLREPTKAKCMRDRGRNKNCNWSKHYKKKCISILFALLHLEEEVKRAKQQHDTTTGKAKNEKATELMELSNELLQSIGQFKADAPPIEVGDDNGDVAAADTGTEAHHTAEPDGAAKGRDNDDNEDNEDDDDDDDGINTAGPATIFDEGDNALGSQSKANTPSKPRTKRRRHLHVMTSRRPSHQESLRKLAAAPSFLPPKPSGLLEVQMVTPAPASRQTEVMLRMVENIGNLTEAIRDSMRSEKMEHQLAEIAETNNQQLLILKQLLGDKRKNEEQEEKEQHEEHEDHEDHENHENHDEQEEQEEQEEQGA
ncbi:hypothetical protein KEM55_007605 [Ascosphaera atra]|nr:hypothetical protein KEM55_007605 [Ascosphaera atra]